MRRVCVLIFSLLMTVFTVLSLYFVSIGRAQQDHPQSRSSPMSFEDCRALLDRQIVELGVSPLDLVPIVRTPILTMTRICTSEGSVLYTCSKLDRKMVITTSPDRDGCRR